MNSWMTWMGMGIHMGRWTGGSKIKPRYDCSEPKIIHFLFKFCVLSFAFICFTFILIDLGFCFLMQQVAKTKEMLSKQAVQTKEMLSKQAVKIAKQAEEHERFINKVIFSTFFFCFLLYIHVYCRYLNCGFNVYNLRTWIWSYNFLFFFSCFVHGFLIPRWLIFWGFLGLEGFAFYWEQVS